MTEEVTISGIVKTSIVTAFTIAAALTWKDVITDAINRFFPEEVFLYEFLAAIIVTIFVIIAIYAVLRTEESVSHLKKKISKLHPHKRKKLIKELKKVENKK